MYFVLLLFFGLISVISGGGGGGEHVHLRVHVPEIIKKHTHTQTIVRHHFYPHKKVVEHHHKKKSGYRGHSRVDPTISTYSEEEISLPKPKYEIKKVKPNYEIVVKKNEKKYLPKLEDYNKPKQLKVLMMDDGNFKEYKITGFGKGYDFDKDDISEHSSEGTHSKFRFSQPISSLHTSFEGHNDYIKLAEKDHLDIPTRSHTSSGWPSAYGYTSPKKSSVKHIEHFNPHDALEAWPISMPSTLKEYSTLPESTELEQYDKYEDMDTSLLDRADVENKSFMEGVRKYLNRSKRKPTPTRIAKFVLDK